jgi:solute carrier family 7 (L-type amino acid transporter), member 6
LNTAEGRPSTGPDTSRSLPAPGLPRSLNFTNGLGLVVGLQIGSGIFSSPSTVINNVGSPILAMFIWLIAGILAWTGAASVIELGSIVPINGGMQEYLRYCYHDIYGFLGAWMWVFIVKPCGVAMISLIFSEYLTRVFTLQENQSIWISKGIAFLAITLVTHINCMGIRVSAGITNAFLVIKLLGLTSIIVTGLTLGTMHFQNGEEVQGIIVRNLRDIDTRFWSHLGAYTDATLAALWAYSGWETVGDFLTVLCFS